jgi:SAM-dependent methyltransferase
MIHYAKPIHVPDLSECLFDDGLLYHCLDLPGIGSIDGRWDLRGSLDDYIGGLEVYGKRVLDVGTASGFLSFEMERRGAEVVSFDASSALDMDRLPFLKSLHSTDRGEWERQVNESIERIKRSYWFAHERLGSQAKAFYGNIYDLPDELGEFDVAVIGQILVHLSDPVSAIGSVGKRCRGAMVITEGMIDSEDRIMGLCADPNKGPDWSWWHLSIGLYRALLQMMGFVILNISQASYDSKRLGKVTLHTIVARRDENSSAGQHIAAW